MSTGTIDKMCEVLEQNLASRIKEYHAAAPQHRPEIQQHDELWIRWYCEMWYPAIPTSKYIQEYREGIEER